MRVVNQVKTTILYEIHSAGKVFIRQYTNKQKEAIKELLNDGYLRFVSDNLQLTDKALNIVHFKANYEDFLKDEETLHTVKSATIHANKLKNNVGIGLFKKLSNVSIKNIIEMVMAAIIAALIIWYFGFNGVRAQKEYNNISPNQKLSPTLIPQNKVDTHKQSSTIVRQKSRSSRLTIASKKQVKEDNSVKIDRSPGAHVIGGSNNQVGVNGDVNINIEKKLDEEKLLAIYNYAKKLQIDSSVENTFHILTAPYCNAPLYASEISEYFHKKGLNITETGIFMSAPNVPNINGIAFNIHRNPDYINIEIGYIP